MPLLGAGAWVGGLLGLLAPVPVIGLVATATILGLLVGRHRGVPRHVLRTAGGLLLLVLAVASVALLREARVGRTPVAALAGQQAVATVELTVTSDPRVREGRFDDYVVLRGRVSEVSGRGATHRVSAPVLVLADEQWLDVPLGARVELVGRLSPARGHDLAGVLTARGLPVVVDGPDLWWRGASRVRESLRGSVAGRPASQRVLVPSLVVGDDAGLDAGLAEDFRVTGLTHLLAVSGTNLTLIVGFLLVVARWCGVRGRWLYVVGAGGIVGFVLLARTEPSVVRAAAMGTVALVGMGSNGMQRGTRALGVAVVVLLLLDPWLATSIGFALSVLATAGILFLAPGWRDAMGRWLPRWVAEAVAVPAAAQLACTPLVAAISGQVSLVAVLTNMLVAPAVGPATVLGLSGGLLGLVWMPAGRVAGTLAAWCVAWIIAVARRGADLPTAALDWGVGAGSLFLLTVLCVAMAVAAPYVLRSRVTAPLFCALVLLVVFTRPPTPGWPPDDWVMVACDVGQGDAVVLRAAPETAIVVDTGPDPGALDECLRRLDIASVPLVVLTHFHADHVDGLAAVLRGREVGSLEVSPVADPVAGADQVTELAREHGLVPQVPAYGVTRRLGDVVWQVLWPPPGAVASGQGDGSSANDASLVLLVRVRGVQALLTGDIEPPSQEVLASSLGDLRVDVLKVPHHGSRHQELDFLLGLGARLALVSSGADNDYGHPSQETLVPLSEAGTTVLRTDLEGDLVVREGEEGLTTTTRQ